jgi:hypothetical protein
MNLETIVSVVLQVPVMREASATISLGSKTGVRNPEVVETPGAARGNLREPETKLVRLQLPDRRIILPFRSTTVQHLGP